MKRLMSVKQRASWVYGYAYARGLVPVGHVSIRRLSPERWSIVLACEDDDFVWCSCYVEYGTERECRYPLVSTYKDILKKEEATYASTEVLGQMKLFTL